MRNEMAREASKRWKFVSDGGDFWLFFHLNMQFLYKNQCLFLLTTAELIGHFFNKATRGKNVPLNYGASNILYVQVMRGDPGFLLCQFLSLCLCYWSIFSSVFSRFSKQVSNFTEASKTFILIFPTSL
jgi:hypothetical protein